MRKSKIKRLDKHVAWLKNLMDANVKIDVEKLSTKKVFSKYFNKENTFERNHNETKYIIDRLVSYNNLKKKAK